MSKKAPTESKWKFDLIIKVHNSGAVLSKYLLDEHLYSLIRNIIEAYHAKKMEEQDGA
jgi:hypothetical protein